MKIEYFGHSCFRFTDSFGQSLITDPYTGIGYELSNGLAADIVTLSHNHYDHNAVHLIEHKHCIKEVGNYNIGNVRLFGVESFHDEEGGKLRGKNTVYKMQIDGITCCHLGDLGEPCHTALIEKIGEVDILFIPIGGHYTIDKDEAQTYIRRIQPKIVIPMHYKTADGTIDISSPDAFLKAFDKVERVGNMYVVNKEDLLNQEMKVVFMEK